MKKMIAVIGKITPVFLLIFLIITGCGGGGGSSSNINPAPSVPTPTLVPTPTATPIPTENLSGSIYNITDNTPLEGCMVNIDGTDYASAGNTFGINYPLAKSIHNITITGANNIARETPFDSALENLDFYLLPSSFNVEHLRALTTQIDPNTNFIHNQDTLRWIVPPRVVIYNQMPDGTDTSHITAEIEKILTEFKNLGLETISDITWEIFDGPPASDPRWIKHSTNTDEHYVGYLEDNSIGICVGPLQNADGITFPMYSDASGTYSGGGITVVYRTQAYRPEYLRILRHELCHALMGAFHPFEIIPEADWPTKLEFSIMNYTETGKSSLVLTEYDIYCFKFIYGRLPNNMPPDKNETPITASSDTSVIILTDPPGF